jgi:hypothetical protein
MPEDAYNPLAELASAQFTPPEQPWNARRAAIYPKFAYFAKIVNQHITEPWVRQELELLDKKLRPE